MPSKVLIKSSLLLLMNLLRLIQSEPSQKLKDLVKESSCRQDDSCPLKYTDTELKERLTEKQYLVTQKRGTERAFTGKFNRNKEDGTYTCAVCNHELFRSSTKYDSGSGWPSFYDVINSKDVHLIKDTDGGMYRVEVQCGKCGAHLGHVFDDGPKPTGLRYCINSASMGFKAEDKPAEPADTLETVGVPTSDGDQPVGGAVSKNEEL